MWRLLPCVLGAKPVQPLDAASSRLINFRMSTALQSRSTAPERFSKQAPFTPTGQYTPFPLILQQCAPRVVRRHGWAGIVRVGVLLLSDSFALLVARLALRGVGDSAWLGSGVARLTRALIPRGTYPMLPTITAVVVGLWVLGTYGSGDSRRDPSKIASGVLLALALMFWTQLWSRGSVVGAVGFLLTILAVVCLVVLARALVDQLARRYRLQHERASRTLVIGDGRAITDAVRHHALADAAEFNIVGVIDVNATAGEPAAYGLDHLVSVIEGKKVDTVVVVGGIADEIFASLVNVLDAAGCTVFALPRLLGDGGFEPTLIWKRGQPMIQITRPALRASQLVLKRALDLVVSVAGVIILAPVFVAIALAIRLDSRGPVFFRQQRVGRGGRVFKILKFRSMVANAERLKSELENSSVYSDQRLFKVRRDPRVTALGTLLRRTSLDELPQLFNVIMGHMSLVGPRPPVPQEVALYDEHHYARFEMRPGITGPWQVGGRNNITDFEYVVSLEVGYMRHWSIWKDFEILIRTFPAVLRMDGAH